MTTYNKLAYIKITLPYLIEACKEDEEIVITDGGSSDGTKEYLTELYNQKKIHQFVSEKDFGEAHGTNKGMLMAKGELIKIITDDDVFDFKAIDVCKNFMLENRLDVFFSNGIGYDLGNGTSNEVKYEKSFYKWKSTKNCFFFCGISLLIRKESLAYLGLFNCSYVIIDFEYTLRITSMPIKLGFYKGKLFCNVSNPNSNSYKYRSRLYNEQIKLNKFYNYNSANLIQRLVHKVINKHSDAKPQSNKIALESEYLKIRNILFKDSSNQEIIY